MTAIGKTEIIKRWLAVVCWCSLALPAVGWTGGSVLNVPAAQSTEVSFQREAESSTDGAQLYTANGDGATAVVNSQILLTASANGQFAHRSAGTPLALIQGGFQLVVGSTPVEIQLAESLLTLKEVSLRLVKIEAGWSVVVDRFFSGGTAEVQGEIKRTVTTVPTPPVIDERNKKSAKRGRRGKAKSTTAQATDPAPSSTVSVETVPYRHSLIPGKYWLVKSDAIPESIDQTQATGLTELALRLKPVLVSGPELSPADVEDSSDLVVVKQGQEDNFDDIEIEEIEVEAGCVEICID